MTVLDFPQLLLILTLILPWVGLSLVTVARFTRWVRLGLPLLPSVALLLVFYPPTDYLEWPGLLLGSQFGVDAVNRTFLALTAVAWLAASVLAVSFAKTVDRSARFLVCFVLAMAGNFTLVLSQDAVSFFCGFAVMSLAAYGLVNHNGDAASTFAGRVYIVLAIAGELLLFAALIAIAHGAGDSRFPLVFEMRPPDWAIACIVLGFGIKAGLLPLHMSIPLSYAAAPLAGGVALAGAMLNAGLLGWLRWLPIGSFELSSWGVLFILVGLFSAFYGVVLGVLQRAPRALLGYSSVSQVGLLMAFIGAGLLAPGQWPVFLPLLAYFVLHHSLAKTALFCASLGNIPRLGPRWIWCCIFSLPALSLIGIPFSSGFFAKAGLKEVVSSLEGGIPALAIWLSIASVGTALLMTRWLYLVLRTQPDETPIAAAPWVALVVTLLVVAAPGFAPQQLRESLITIEVLGTAIWPLLLASVVAGCVWYWQPRNLASLVGRVPNGDIAWVIARALNSLLALARGLESWLGQRWSTVSMAVMTRLARIANRFFPS